MDILIGLTGINEVLSFTSSDQSTALLFGQGDFLGNSSPISFILETESASAFIIGLGGAFTLTGLSSANSISEPSLILFFAFIVIVLARRARLGICDKYILPLNLRSLTSI